MANLTVWLFVCLALALLGLFMLYVFPSIYINRQAISWARRNATGYLDSLKNGDPAGAARYVSRMVLSDDKETSNWVEKISSEVKAGKLTSYRLGAPSFRSMTGNFTGEGDALIPISM